MEVKKTMNIRLHIDEWEFLVRRSSAKYLTINALIRDYINKDRSKEKKELTSAKIASYTSPEL
jgi:hypothetical protein